MRKKYVAGNWKMNLQYAEAMALVDAIVDYRKNSNGCRVILAPPFLYLHEMVSRVQGTEDIYIAAQNCSEHSAGAFTGEIAAAMLSSIGTDFVIIGHSERRNIYGESDEIMASKIRHALDNSLIPVLCCGEKLSERKEGKQNEVVFRQLEKAFEKLNGKEIENCLIAYEPVWAIGTGVTASPLQAQEMHATIREYLSKQYGPESAAIVSILYGGSVNAQNAHELFACADVDGGLVGGASLLSHEFISIIRHMDTLKA